MALDGTGRVLWKEKGKFHVVCGVKIHRPIDFGRGKFMMAEEEQVLWSLEFYFERDLDLCTSISCSLLHV